MLETPVIRPAAVSDLGELTELDRQVFGPISYPYFVFRQFLDLCGEGLIISQSAKGLDGYALVAITSLPDAGYFISLGVHSRARGSGRGRALAQAGMRHLDEMGAQSVKLTVEPNNSAAIGLYQSLGFVIQRRETAYFGPDQPRLIMTKALGS